MSSSSTDAELTLLQDKYENLTSEQDDLLVLLAHQDKKLAHLKARLVVLSYCKYFKYFKYCKYFKYSIFTLQVNMCMNLFRNAIPLLFSGTLCTNAHESELELKVNSN